MSATREIARKGYALIEKLSQMGSEGKAAATELLQNTSAFTAASMGDRYQKTLAAILRIHPLFELESSTRLSEAAMKSLPTSGKGADLVKAFNGNTSLAIRELSSKSAGLLIELRKLGGNATPHLERLENFSTGPGLSSAITRYLSLHDALLKHKGDIPSNYLPTANAARLMGPLYVGAVVTEGSLLLGAALLPAIGPATIMAVKEGLKASQEKVENSDKLSGTVRGTYVASCTLVSGLAAGIAGMKAGFVVGTTFFPGYGSAIGAVAGFAGAYFGAVGGAALSRHILGHHR